MGLTPNYEPAARMATLTYDNELAELAELNVRRCDFEHDRCANTGNAFFILHRNEVKETLSIAFHNFYRKIYICRSKYCNAIG